ncbi:MAG: hypothetical protein V8R91_16555 [Butyricimonas faecihominis]
MEKELEEISLEGKEEFYAQIELNRAILTKDKEKIISMAEKNILDSNNSNTWDIMNALNSLKSELTDKELNRTAMLKHWPPLSNQRYQQPAHEN